MAHAPAPLRRLISLLFAGIFLGVSLPVHVAAAENLVSAVVSRVDPGYHRKKLPNGSFEKEYFAFSYGGQAAGTTSDASIDRVNAAFFVNLLRQHLQEQSYLLAPDAKSADLLLYIKWGRTIPGSDTNYQQSLENAGQSLSALSNLGVAPSGGFGLPRLTPEQQAAQDQAEGDLMALMMEKKARDLALAPTAQLLGYIDAINDTNDIRRWAGGGDHYDELVSDISEPRYYLLVFAYDFRRLATQHERKLLWLTRISIRARGNRFDKRLADMVARAGHYFGRSSGGLQREYKGTVELGELKVVSDDADTSGSGPGPQKASGDDEPATVPDAPTHSGKPPAGP